MATVLNRGALFPAELIPGLINGVKGRSSLAALSKQEPIAFNGQTEFVFTMDSKIDVVAESGAKSHGGVTITPRTIVPIKVEYGARFSRELWFSAEEAQMDILRNFGEGFSRQVAEGLDLMAFHGVNPRSGAASGVIGNNHFDSKVTQEVEYVPGAPAPNDNIEAAVAAVQGSGGKVTGIAMSPIFSAELAKVKVSTDGPVMYPQLAWGGNPGSLNGINIDINSTVSGAEAIAKDRAIAGDFQNAFKWGYSKEIPVTVIEAGDPDNSGKDLNGYNQIYVRAEIFLGWGILDAGSFARIVDKSV